jgi:hypothetical protein
MAAYFDLKIEQGATFRRVFTWRDSNGALVNLTGYTARMQIRRRKSSTDVEHSATTSNGGIALGGALGTVTVTIPANVTEDFAFNSGVYDLELVASDNVVTRFVEGAVEVSKEVTR